MSIEADDTLYEIVDVFVNVTCARARYSSTIFNVHGRFFDNAWTLSCLVYANRPNKSTRAHVICFRFNGFNTKETIIYAYTRVYYMY